MSLESGYTARLTIHHPNGDIVLDMETWEDGNLSSNSTRHRNPITRRETARGGLRTRDTLKMARECDAGVWALKDRIEDSIGRDRVDAIRQMVGPRGEAIGEPKSLTGILDDAKIGSFALDGDAVDMLEVEVDVDE